MRHRLPIRLYALSVLVPAILLAAGCGREEAPPAGPKKAAAPPASPADRYGPSASAPTFPPGPARASQPAAQSALAIAPLINPSKRQVHQSELLTEYFRLAVGGAFEASGGGALVPPAQVDSVFEKRVLDREKSVSDSDLIEIARQIGSPCLLSWEPHENEKQDLFLRLRLASTPQGAIVYREDLATSHALATYISFLNLYAAGVAKAASAALKAVAPKRQLLHGGSGPAPARPLASGLGELGLGAYLPQCIADVRSRPGDAEAWANLSRAYSRLAASLRSPSAMKKRLATRALAAADLGRMADPASSRLHQSSAFANWLNHLNRRASDDLAFPSKPDAGDAQSEILAGLLRGGAPRPLTPPGQSQAPQRAGMEDPDFCMRLQAQRFEAWWRNPEAAACLRSAKQDPWDPASRWELAEIGQAAGADEADPVGAALFRASFWLFEAGIPRAWEQGTQIQPVLENLKSLDPALESLAEAIARGKAESPSGAQTPPPAPGQAVQGPDANTEMRFTGKSFSVKAFLRGEGELAALARLAATTANSVDPAAPASGDLLAWTSADWLAHGQALLADAWRVAWDSAALGAEEADVAREAFEFAEILVPNNPSILTAKAVFFDQIAPDASVRNQALAQARKADPEYVPAARMATVLREPARGPDQAALLYEQVRGLDPFDVNLICWMAGHLARLGQRERAVTALYSARAIDPKDPLPYLGLLDIYGKRQLGFVDSRMVAEMLAYYPATPALRLQAARLYYENQQAERAADLAASLAESNPERFEPAALLARIQAYLGREPEMSRTLDRFVSRKPPRKERIAALRLKGDLLARRGEAEQAAAAYAAAAELAPQSAQALFDLGKAQREAGQPEAALETLRTASRLHMQGAAALEMGRILIDRGETEPARTVAREAQAAQAYAPGGYELEALIRIGQGDAAGAEEAMKRLMEQAPRNPLAFLALANVHARLGQHDKAAKAARDGLALRIDSADGPLLKALTKAEIESGALDEAREDLRRLEILYFDDPDALVLLARADLAEGRKTEAQARLSVALRICPSHAEGLKYKDEGQRTKDERGTTKAKS